MEEKLYSVDEVAEILHLHPRTVRRYIREGVLVGQKIGKEWRITRSALNTLLGEEHMPEKSAALKDQSEKVRFQVSAVADIQVQNEDEALRISNTILAALNGKGPEYSEVRFDFLYDKTERKARYVFWGDPAFIGTLLILFAKIKE
jgi:excisionase family DNA binding protein